jgi:hypothetical protein
VISADAQNASRRWYCPGALLVDDALELVDKNSRTSPEPTCMVMVMVVDDGGLVRGMRMTMSVVWWCFISLRIAIETSLSLSLARSYRSSCIVDQTST